MSKIIPIADQQDRFYTFNDGFPELQQRVLLFEIDSNGNPIFFGDIPMDHHDKNGCSFIDPDEGEVWYSANFSHWRPIFLPDGKIAKY